MSIALTLTLRRYSRRPDICGQALFSGASNLIGHEAKRRAVMSTHVHNHFEKASSHHPSYDATGRWTVIEEKVTQATAIPPRMSVIIAMLGESTHLRIVSIEHSSSSAESISRTGLRLPATRNVPKGGDPHSSSSFPLQFSAGHARITDNFPQPN